MADNGISTLSTKQARQIAKLDLSAAKRVAQGNPRDTYDITELPTQYSGNTIVDNANEGGLIQGRPWIVAPSLVYADGLYRREYSGYFSDNVNYFATATETAATVNTSPIQVSSSGDNFSNQWIGYFKPSTTETYTFYTSSDDGSFLWIGETALSGFTTTNATVKNGGLHGVIERSGTAALTADTYYPIRIQFGENGGGESITVSISTPTISKTSNLSGKIFYNSVTNGF